MLRSTIDDDRPDRNEPPGGFSMISNYAQYFWRPYLGLKAFSLWEILQSFCYGNKSRAWP